MQFLEKFESKFVNQVCHDHAPVTIAGEFCVFMLQLNYEAGSALLPKCGVIHPAGLVRGAQHLPEPGPGVDASATVPARAAAADHWKDT